MHFQQKVHLLFEKIFYNFCEYFAKSIWNFAKISQYSTILFSRNFAKVKIISPKFRVPPNF